MLKFVAVVAVAGALSLGYRVGAQTPGSDFSTGPGPAVVGYKGEVSILPNPELRQTTVALTIDSVPAGQSNQIVFHLQQAGSEAPDAWSGHARVLTSDGVLAILPDGQQQGSLFKFPEIVTPRSLQPFGLTTYGVYGIARFGEKTPLTSAQIQELASTGRVKGLSGGLALPVAPIPGFSVTPEDAISCTAGGPGSTSCTFGGCSVTCGGGYYSCCADSVCFCVKVKIYQQ